MTSKKHIIMRKLINMSGKIFRAYLRKFGEMYKPMIDAGVNPWL